MLHRAKGNILTKVNKQYIFYKQKTEMVIFKQSYFPFRLLVFLYHSCPVPLSPFQPGLYLSSLPFPSFTNAGFAACAFPLAAEPAYAIVL